MAKSTLFAWSLLTKVFNDDEFYWLPLTDFYVSLHTDDPGTSGDQTTNECDYGDYARVTVARTSDSWAVTDNEVVNSIEIKFPACESGTNTARYYAIGTEQIGEGDIIYSGVLTSPLAISINVQPRFPVGFIVIREL